MVSKTQAVLIKPSTKAIRAEPIFDFSPSYDKQEKPADSLTSEDAACLPCIRGRCGLTATDSYKSNKAELHRRGNPTGSRSVKYAEQFADMTGL